MTLNVDLLNKVKQHILEEPARLRMDIWIRRGFPGEIIPSPITGYNEPDQFKLPACGTVACLAGWAVVLTNPELVAFNPDLKGKELLGIDSDLMPYDLFYPDQWPLHFRLAYEAAESLEDRARIAGDVIDQFIADYPIPEEK